MSSLMSDDVRDLRDARRGDTAAFARIYDRHAGVVLALCRHHLPTDSEDAMQDTFVRAFRMLEQLEHADRLRSWLYAIARHVCSERRRSSARRAKHEGNTHAMNIRLATPENPAITASRGEQLDLLDVAMRQLPDDQRLALHLFYLDQNPVAAAQSVLGLTRSGFYKLLARARDSLRRLMREVPIQ